jgi:membrane-bound ClpP family serine protease
MEQLTVAVILQVVGIVLLVFDVFIPSHGALSVGGLTCLGAGIWCAFRLSSTAGYVSVLVASIVVPTLIVTGVKMWHRTPLGRRISPPNPRLTDADKSVDVSTLGPLVGTIGRTITPLRPVGTCEFDGRRVECVAEMGLIEAGQFVRAVRIEGRELVVQPQPAEPAPSG